MSGVARFARTITPAIVFCAVVAVVWVGGLSVLRINPQIGAQPWAVVGWLGTAPNGAHTLDLLGTTLRDSGSGFLVGLAVAGIVATLFTMAPSIEQAITPLLLLFRVIPLVVLTPVLTLVFGGGSRGVTAAVCVVVFFPALALIVYGLRSTPQELVDLVHVNGGNRLTTLAHVRIPAAIPSLIAAASVTVPGAVTGATIGEWLVTGEGLGGSMSRAAGAFSFVEVWADAALLTLATVLAHSLFALTSTAIAARFDPSAERAS